jgi:hypothetical protein
MNTRKAELADRLFLPGVWGQSPLSNPKIVDEVTKHITLGRETGGKVCWNS